MKGLILAALIVGSSVQSQSDPSFQRNWTINCSSVAKVQDLLSGKYQEKVVAEISRTGSTIQIWENRRDEGTWSLVMLDPYGYACLVAVGKGKWKFPLR